MKKIMIILFAMSFLTVQKIAAQRPDSLPCPNIVLDHPGNYQVKEGTDAVFAVVSFPKEYDKLVLTYNWSVSNGSIIKGQGTSTIYVNTKGLLGQTITATVDIGGIKRECLNVKSVTVEVVGSKP